jgi:hypothetical protein
MRWRLRRSHTYWRDVSVDVLRRMPLSGRMWLRYGPPESPSWRVPAAQRALQREPPAREVQVKIVPANCTEKLTHTRYRQGRSLSRAYGRGMQNDVEQAIGKHVQTREDGARAKLRKVTRTGLCQCRHSSQPFSRFRPRRQERTRPEARRRWRSPPSESPAHSRPRARPIRVAATFPRCRSTSPCRRTTSR